MSEQEPHTPGWRPGAPGDATVPAPYSFATATPPPHSWPAPPAPPRRPWHRRPGTLVAAALAAVLVAGGVGGAVGYEAASSATGAGESSVLANAPVAGDDAPAPAGSVEAVAQRVLPSMVQLRGVTGEGSGIVISRDGLILTNAHVLRAGPGRAAPGGLTARFQDGTSAPVEVVGTDATADLAVVRARGVENLTPVELGSSADLAVGQQVVALGSPLGLSGTVTSGIVSAVQRPVATGGAGSGQSSVLDAIQTDAAINPGNSGGALVDMQGRVVGITTAIATLGSGSAGGGRQPSGSIGLGFAIPVDQAARIGNELVARGFANQAVLGATVTNASNGAALGTLTPGGAAESAGLSSGDVVTRVDDRVVGDADGLVAAIRSQPPGTQVTLSLAAGATQRQVPVTLGAMPAPSG